MKKIACIGMVAVDMIVSPVVSLPPLGHCQRVDTVKMFVGGCASNTALDLAKLGLPVRLACRLGDDSLGRFAYSEFSRYGINTQSVTMSEGVGTCVSIACLDPVEKNRRSLLTTQSNDLFDAGDISEELFQKCGIIFLSGICQLKQFDGPALAAFAKKAHDAGKLVVMDIMWDLDDLWLPKFKEALPYVDLFMPSYDEVEKALHLTDPVEMIKGLRALGPKNVVIKLGKDGVIVMEGDAGPYRLAAWELENVVDTTGAGDAFCAGVLTGLAKEMPLRDAVALGQTVAAFCIQDYGTYAGIRPLDQVFYAMNAGRIEPYNH